MQRRSVVFRGVLALGVAALLASCGGSDDDAGGPAQGDTSSTEAESPSSTEAESAAEGASAGDLADVDPCSLLTDEELGATLSATVNEGPTAGTGDSAGRSSCSWTFGDYAASEVGSDNTLTEEQQALLYSPGNGSVVIFVVSGDAREPALEGLGSGYTISESDEVDGVTIGIGQSTEAEPVSYLDRRGVLVQVLVQGGLVPGTGNAPRELQLPDGAGTDELFALYQQISDNIDQL